jgi:hypothetical protein
MGGLWAVAVATLLSCDHGLVPSSTVALVEQAGQTSRADARVLWDDPVELVTGPARVGPWRMNESEFHYVDDASVGARDHRSRPRIQRELAG